MSVRIASGAGAIAVLLLLIATACGEGEAQPAPAATPTPLAMSTQLTTPLATPTPFAWWIRERPSWMLTAIPTPTPTPTPPGQFAIAYVDDEGRDIWVVPADGIGKHNVTIGRCPQLSQFYWSPKGDSIACIRPTDDGKTEIRTFSSDPVGYQAGSGLERDGVFAGFSAPGMAEASPSSLWSPLGTMAYVLEEGSPSGAAQLYIGRDEEVIAGGQQPRWSADGELVAYNKAPDDTLVIFDLPWTEGVLGQGMRPLAWVLDDTSLLVAAEVQTSSTGSLAYEANLVDLHTVEMTRVPELDNSAEFWLSPDRTRAVILREGTSLGVLDLVTLRLSAIDGSFISSPGDYIPRHQLTFSPDGSRIYWFDGNEAIYSAGSDGTGLIQVGPLRDVDTFLGFSPDVTQVLYRPGAEGSGLWVANVDGSGAHQVADSNSSMAAWAPQASLPEPVTIDGVRVVPLNLGEEMDIPDDVALIVRATCEPCGGSPGGDLLRVYRDASGQLRMDELFGDELTGRLPLPAGRGSPRGVVVNSDASEMVADVCTRGDCQWIQEASPDAQSTLYRSTDGGVTWEELGVLDGKRYVVAITKEGLVVRAWGQETEWKPKYELFTSGESVEPPPEAGKELPLTLPDGELAWPTEDGRLLRSDGSQILTVSQGETVRDHVQHIVPDASGERLAVGSLKLIGVFSHDGRPISLFSLMNGAVGAWLSDTLVVGKAYVPGELLPTPEQGFVVLPTIFDLESGEAHPILHPFLDQPLRHSYIVRAVQRGPFARVVNTGGCLNVRQDPGATAATLACAADGVLLRDTGETREVDGGVWVRVVTPAGVEGWASAQYLER
jgi:hypothetical protein